MKLSDGVWMAQGPSQNVIIKVVGEQPFIKIVKGVLMNDFFNYGRVKELNENSLEIQHILQNPSLYNFEYLTVTQAVLDTVGVGTRTFQKWENLTDEDIKELVEQYQNHLKIYGNTNDSAFIIKMCKEYRITTGQASNVLENKVKRILSFTFG